MKNFGSFLTIMVSVSLLCSCVKDYKSSTTVKLKNNTTHIVELFAFKDGVLDISKSFVLYNFSEKVIENTNTWGKSKVPIAFGEYFVDVDSIQAKWNDSFIVTYMISGNYSSNGKFIAYDDTVRNLSYMNGYNEYLVEDHKKYSIWQLTFNFTESDYEYAKD